MKYTQQQFGKVQHILIALSERITPDKNHGYWCSITERRYWKCFICPQTEIFNQEHTADNIANFIRTHGMNHLIEKNLLPFI